MVTTKPRFGGGSNMEHVSNIKTKAILEKLSRKMEGRYEKQKETPVSNFNPTFGEPEYRSTEARYSRETVDEFKYRSGLRNLSLTADDPYAISTTAISEDGGLADAHQPVGASAYSEICFIAQHAKAKPYATSTCDVESVNLHRSVLHGNKQFGNQANSNCAVTEDDCSHRLALSNGEKEPRLRKLLELFDEIKIKSKPRVYTRLKGDETPQSPRKETEEDALNSCHQVDSLLQNENFQQCNPNLGKSRKVVYCKNLFVKDKKKQFYIIIAEESCVVDLKKLKTDLNVSRNLSFALNTELRDILQLNPGEVTPLAIMQNSAKNVRIVFHESLSFVRDCGDVVMMAFHPFTPLLQIDISYSELVLFVAHCGRKLEILGSANQTDGPEQVDPITNASFLKDDNSNAAEMLWEKSESMGNSKRKERNSRLQLGDRKGKLKSYVKKHVRDNVSTMNDQRQNLNGTNIKDQEPQVPDLDLEMEVKTEIKTTLDIESESLSNKVTNVINLEQLNSAKKLPEISLFYEILKKHNIHFSEIDVSMASSIDIGPSLGARCFLMKDRRQNYFLIVSHEFYELDYGRLKKSLQPKKKLDECNESDLLIAVGVDCEHFTPFAIMNQRAIQNEVRLFFTEKIKSHNVILCIQHPFAQGRRIIMTSCELQRLLVNFCDENGIGSVEEKVWHRRYNRPFAQFEPPHTKEVKEVQIHQSTNPIKTEIDAECKQISEKGEGSEERVKGQDYDGVMNLYKDNWLNGHHEENNGNLQRIAQNMSVSCITKLFELFQMSAQIIGLKRNLTQEEFNALGDAYGTGTSVDGEEFDNRNTVRCVNKCAALPPNKHASFPESNFECKQWEESGKQTSLKPHPGNTSHYRRQPNSGEKSLTLQEEVNSLNHTMQSQRQPNLLKNQQTKFSIHDIENHLGDYDVGYMIVPNFGKHCEEENLDGSSTSQECCTLHMADDSSKHYIVIGRESEQVGVKRVRRRFHIQKKLYLIDDYEDADELCDHHVGSSNSKNPFEIFMSVSNHCRNHDAADLKRVASKVRFVLFSSIYMDPDMTCIFVLDKQGTSLLISAQDLENYARKAGIEVWYMP